MQRGFKPAAKNGFGYKIENLKEPKLYTHYAVFIGNKYTRKDKANIYSRLAAVKHCEEKGTVAILMDKSADFSREYLSNNLGTTSNGGLYNYISAETIPAYATYFLCVEKYVELAQNIQLNTVSKELMKNFVDDFGSAVQASKVAQGGPLLEDDVITKAAGMRVKDPLLLLEALQKVSGNEVELTLIRSKKAIQKKVPLLDRTGDFREIANQTKIDYCRLETQNRSTDDLWMKSCLEEL